MTATRTANAGWRQEERELFLGLYGEMTRIRRFEELIQSLFLKGEVYGTTHLYSGQEAVAVGVSSALDERDRVAGTYRGHGHALAQGVGASELLDEMLGRATGINGGRSGSMNVTSMRHGYMGSYGIVGGSIAAATGAAMAVRRQGGVAVAYFGDGATNQGYFFECLNFAHVFRLPVLFVCENNLYMEYTLTEAVSGGDILSRSVSLGVPAEQVDGMEVWSVREAAGRAVERARAGEGPTLLEAQTYRFVGHSRSDPARYRPAGELERWRERDPLVLTRARLEREGVEPAALDAIESAVADELEAARERGLAAPWPDPATLPPEFAEQLGDRASASTGAAR
ncbi:thiamine pyrophosphate-dependent dehydrogenase E1 component subunit alpha [Conexibacter stalactiti]|uniref:Thiamine pyrophosphate-dependent dehydrogenase E1 component subunit alpha n=1 Tax=Conexibacter stalactiti TaxID=1940611 RepID=A0ABU4HLF0_9ACTN|nr:thiamine pyrophosphate-dependent dehydrogenase E1 component subunit alpha [Conexibacter stalactiti]MDW5594090.1 thiamine pyrophosphate-dependent dehydrogenase E1 component subunit alpha [Conexibacter stalactiti]MEC5034732.1 thiamine pyrophosphate-dependent dehydrogenase E1 component subunit alpha [Conexibacter stalactiti]